MSIATGGIPPVVVNVSVVNGVPDAATIVVATGRIAMDVQLTTKLYVSLCVQPEPSVTVNVSANVPVWPGMPARFPVAGSKDIPDGNAPDSESAGLVPPTIVKVWLYGAPSEAAGSVAGTRLAQLTVSAYVRLGVQPAPSVPVIVNV